MENAMIKVNKLQFSCLFRLLCMECFILSTNVFYSSPAGWKKQLQIVSKYIKTGIKAF